MHETTARTAPALWPADDTEWSVVGTDLHQGTITDARTGINEAAVAVAPPGGAHPFQAGGQTLIIGMRRPDGSPYRVLPDVFVYRGTFDRLRRSLSLRREGVPALVIEVLSQDTREVDLDMAEGKGWTYAAAGVAEYLILDPIGRYVRTQVQGWRLAGGLYTSWLPDVRGRWASALGFGFGFEGLKLVVYGADGRAIPGEGGILRALAEGEAAGEARGLAEGEARGLAEGLLVGRSMLLRLLRRRFGPLPPELEARIALLAAATMPAMVEAALDAASIEAFSSTLDSALQ